MTVIVALTCLMTPTVSLFCSVLSRRSSASLTTAYLALAGLFWFPAAADVFTRTFFPGTLIAGTFHALSVVSPVAALFSVPLSFASTNDVGTVEQAADWPIFFGHLLFQTAAITALLFAVGRLFRNRYDAGES
jgi:hypothetical protein